MGCRVGQDWVTEQQFNLVTYVTMKTEQIIALFSYGSVLFTSVAQSCPTLCDPNDCSVRSFPVLHYLSEFAQTHVHWVSDAIQSSHPLSPPLIIYFFNFLYSKAGTGKVFLEGPSSKYLGLSVILSLSQVLILLVQCKLSYKQKQMAVFQ